MLKRLFGKKQIQGVRVRQSATVHPSLLPARKYALDHHGRPVVDQNDEYEDAPIQFTNQIVVNPVAAVVNPVPAVSLSEHPFVHHLMMNQWRGVINVNNRESCVVVDMTLTVVRILATKAYKENHTAYLSMISDLKRREYSIEYEGIGTEAEIAEVYKLSSQKFRALTGNVDREADRDKQFFEDVMAAGYRFGASDVHFEIDNGYTGNIYFRIHGRKRKWREYKAILVEKAVAAGYGSFTKTGTNSGGSFSPERGMTTMTKHQIDGVTVEGRFSSLPTTDGCDVVVRLINSDPRAIVIKSLDELGYSPSQSKVILECIQRNSGLIAIAGSTGSGKTTSLRTFMHIIPRKEELKIVAVEDPSEYPQPGVRKFTIQRGPDDPEDVVKAKYLAVLRQQMRMDPDVIMIGEIRDSDSASIASELVQTGHRVLTSIHGDGAVDVLSRSCGKVLQIPEEILSMRKFISSSIYQKLLPVLCNCCKRPALEVLSAETIDLLRNKFKLNPETMFCASEDGCDECKIKGIEGSGGTVDQTVCAEILVPNSKMRELVRQRNWNGIEQLWRSERITGFDDPDMTGKTAFEHGLYKVSQGISDVRDLEADFESLSTYEVFEPRTPNVVALAAGGVKQ